MRYFRGLIVASVAGVGIIAAAFGQTTPPRRKTVSGPSKPAPFTEQQRKQQLDAVLEQWERVSSRLRTLDVVMTRQDISPAWGDPVEYQGRAYLQSPDLAAVEFHRIDGTRKPPELSPHEKIICGKDHILQYVYDTKQIFVFPLEKDERTRALEEGPLPFLFNMQAEKLKRRYDLILSNQDDKYYVIKITPRLASDRGEFGKAYLWLGKTSYMPQMLLLKSPNGSDSKQYRFTTIRPNAQLSSAVFQGKMIAGWTVVKDAAGK